MSRSPHRSSTKDAGSPDFWITAVWPSGIQTYHWLGDRLTPCPRVLHTKVMPDGVIDEGLPLAGESLPPHSLRELPIPTGAEMGLARALLGSPESLGHLQRSKNSSDCTGRAEEQSGSMQACCRAHYRDNQRTKDTSDITE